MRIAVVYDYIPPIGGGAERVLLDILRVFSPHCDLFLGGIVDSEFSRNYLEQVQQEFPEMKVTIKRKISGFRSIAFRIFNYQLVSIMQSIDLSEYDIVFCYTSFLAHTVITPPHSHKIVYMNTPARSLWHLSHSTSFLKKIMPPVLMEIMQSGIRQHDMAALRTADYVLAISQSVQQRISSFYSIPSGVLYPPVHRPLEADISLVAALQKEYGQYVLHFSRIESYKNIQLLVDTSSEIEENIIIAGEGPFKKELINYSVHRLKQLPRLEFSETLQKDVIKVGNLTFTGFVSEEQKSSLISGAFTTFCLNDEDFGITKVESLSLGTPVIALAAGAAPEVIRSGIDGVLFENNSAEALLKAIKEMKTLKFDTEILKKRAELFSFEHFSRKISAILSL